jgi:hypothetical protein
MLVRNCVLLFRIENFVILINAYDHEVNTIHLMTLSYIIILADNTNNHKGLLVQTYIRYCPELVRIIPVTIVQFEIFHITNKNCLTSE